MKIHLSVNEPLEGYRNLFPGQGNAPVGFERTAVNDFLGVSPNELRELVVSEVLEKLDPEDVEKTVRYWVGCLAHQAVLHITFRDLEETCQQIATRSHSVTELNRVLYANRSAHTADSVSGMLSAMGLHIHSVIMNSAFCTVTAIRP